METLMNLIDDILLVFLKKCILPKGTPTSFRIRGETPGILNPRMRIEYVYPDGASLACFHYEYAACPGHKDPYEVFNIAV